MCIRDSPLERRPELPPVPERWEHIGGPAGGPERPPEPPRPVPLAQALKEAHHLTLLGEPGAGKTTTLQFVGLCFARPGWARARLELEEGRIPILLDLRRYADVLAGPGPRMEEALY